MKRLLITGGLGYLGGRIAQKLSENAEYQLILTSQKYSNKESLPFEVNQIMQMSLMSDSDIASACRGAKYIVHLAASNEIESQKDPAMALLINTLGTLKLLKQAEKKGVERFIYFSTAHVYGAPLLGHIDERTLPRPQHPYAITHKAAEDFVLAAHTRGNICGIVVRLSNGYGAPLSSHVNRWTLVVNDLCKQAVVKKKLTLLSSGNQKRDFIAISDVARAVAHFLKLSKARTGDGLFNLGGENVLTILQIADRISERCLKVLGYRPPIDRPESEAKEDMQNLLYDISKLKSTGFALQGDMDKEIDNTLLLCQKAFAR
jgi:UDP-glucose 4-epimerase